MIRFALGVLAASVLVSNPAGAADLDEPAVAAQPSGTDIVIELGLGAAVVPKYAGSKDYEVVPLPVISLDYLSIPGLFSFGSIDPQRGGFSIGPSFGYTGKRDSDDYGELTGLRDVDATYEGGIRLSYEWDYAEVYGEARYAFGGADGFVGDVGANLVARPTQELQFKAGPVLSFASDGYMDGYFRVSPDESVASGGRLGAYDPDGGFQTAGVAASARYEFRPTWFLNAEASWNRFIGDAEKSPIVEVGDKNQFEVGLALSKRFQLDLF